jgi:hypothetical protein
VLLALRGGCGRPHRLLLIEKSAPTANGLLLLTQPGWRCVLSAAWRTAIVAQYPVDVERQPQRPARPDPNSATLAHRRL